MINIYYRSVFTIFIVFYVLLYISSSRLCNNMICVNKIMRVILGKSNKKTSIPLFTIIGHIFNLIILAIGVIGNKIVNAKLAFIIYKWSIPVFLILLAIIEEYLSRNE